EPRSLEKFGMIAGIQIESDADSEGEVVFADNAIPAGVSISAGDVSAAAVSPQSETEFALMGLATKAKWNNSGRNLYKLIDSSMSVRTKRGLGLNKYIEEDELGIDDSKFSILHTTSDELEGEPIYNRCRNTRNEISGIMVTVVGLRTLHTGITRLKVIGRWF
nr:hypothetical protein [Tanacetum cinerariifolium]